MIYLFRFLRNCSNSTTVNVVVLVRVLVVLVLPGLPADNVCTPGPGIDICAFPEVTEKEVFLIKCASRQKNKALEQREETCTCGSAQIAVKKLEK